MTTFTVKARKKGQVVVGDVTADSREGAIAAVVQTAAPGEEVEVWEAIEVLGTAGATGATGATGPAFNWAAGATGHAGRAGGFPQAGPVATDAKVTRAQLNDMSKEELLAVAEKEGAEVNANWNKADIVDAIVKHK